MVKRQLKLIRTQNGLTQQQVADALGISRSAYCGYETGRRTPDLALLTKLSDFYKIMPGTFVNKILGEYVYSDDFVEKQPEATYLSQLSKEERDLIVNFRIASDKGRKEITHFAKEKSGRNSL